MKMHTWMIVFAIVAEFSAQAESVCRTLGFQISVNEEQGEVQFVDRNPFNSERLFVIKDEMSFGHHEQVTVVFAKNNCSILVGEKITCQGKPLRASAMPYWTRNDVPVDIEDLRLTVQEMAGIRLGDNKPFYQLQAFWVGNTVGRHIAVETQTMTRDCPAN